MAVIKKGSVDVTRYVMLRDSTAGTPETGYTITNLDLQYTRNQSTPAAKVDATALAATNTAHTDNYAIQVDATSSPGLYRIDWPDAAFATGADKVLLVVSGSGLDPAVEEIELVDYVPADNYAVSVLASGTADSGTTTTLVDSARTEGDSYWIGARVLFTSGTLAGQSRIIVNFQASIDTITFTPAVTTAVTTHDYVIIPGTGYVESLTSAAQTAVQTACQTGMQAYQLDHLFQVADPGGVVANNSFWAKLVSKSSTAVFTDYDNTTDSLQALRDRGDAAWVTATGFSTLDAAGVRTAVGLASANLDTQLSAIVTDTNELQTDWVNGGRLDLLLDATLADTNELQGDWTNGGRLDLLLDSTLADTNELQTDWANGGRLDLIVDAILDDTGTAGVVVAAGSKTGYALSSTGLDLVVPADPSAIPVLGTSSIVVWIGYFGAWSVNEVNSDADSVNLRNSADSADLAAHTVSDNGTVFSSGEAT